MKFSLSLPGSPISKPRPRAGKHGFYNPEAKEEKEAKEKIREQLKLLPLLQLPSENAISVHFCCFFRYPLSFSAKRKSATKWKTTRPDLDNLIKFYKDVLNDIVYKDDSQVVKLSGEKCYSLNEEKTIIYVEILD